MSVCRRVAEREKLKFLMFTHMLWLTRRVPPRVECKIEQPHAVQTRWLMYRD